MAQLTVGSFVFTFSHLHTQALSVTPVMDPSGMDLECQEVRLEVMGVVNPSALAVGAGQPLPTTISGIRDSLMAPRQNILFEVAGQTVLMTPALPASGKAPMSCDVRGGPIVEDAKYTEIAGDKSAILYFRCKTWVSYAPTFVLSNRWSTTSTTDDMGMTTRSIRGRVAFRKDFLDNNVVGGVAKPMQPDDFRVVVVPPLGQGMRRTGIVVTQNEAGNELMYTATDKEFNIGTGSASKILRIECLPTVGVDIAIKDSKSMAKALWGMTKSAFKLDFSGLIEAGLAAVPTAKSFGVARVWGRRGTAYPDMVRVGTSMLLDRLAPSRVFPAVQVSCFVTSNKDTDNPPWVEVRMEFVGMNLNVLNSLISGDPSRLLNTASVVAYRKTDGSTDGVLASGGNSAPNMEGSKNTRGSWQQRLVAQALLGPTGGISPLPPITQPSVDVPAMS